MQQYSINNSAAVAGLLFRMYPPSPITHGTSLPPSPTAEKKSTNNSINCDNHLLNIDTDELIKLLKSKFEKQEEKLYKSYAPEEVIITQHKKKLMNLNLMKQKQQQNYSNPNDKERKIAN
ncbi:unnamed protein product [Rotaria sp. Silwood2]|nr:unnamed protein product [Rotaria sp. Silwood2]CAF4233328.1 unnamed protein product [Rotaria sp. Silwood2]